MIVNQDLRQKEAVIGLVTKYNNFPRSVVEKELLRSENKIIESYEDANGGKWHYTATLGFMIYAHYNEEFHTISLTYALDPQVFEILI